MAASGERMPEMVAAEVDGLSGLSDEQLGDKITRFAAHRNAAEFRWLAMIAEFDRREIWADWECRSMAHWLSWRCGTTLHTGREKVRVARSLEGLPQTSAAFARGQLSYSQVRAISRVADENNEDRLLVLARYGTAAQLERAVRAFRRVAAAQDPDRESRQRARQETSWWYDDDGMFNMKVRLPGVAGPRVVAAMESARRELPDDIDDGANSHEEDDHQAGDDHSGGRDLDAVPAGTSRARTATAEGDDGLADEVADADRSTADTDVPVGTDQTVTSHAESDVDDSGEQPSTPSKEPRVAEETADVPAGTCPDVAFDAVNAPAEEWSDLPAGEFRDVAGHLSDIADLPSNTKRRNADAFLRMVDSYLAGDRDRVSSADRHRILVHLIYEKPSTDTETEFTKGNEQANRREPASSSDTQDQTTGSGSGHMIPTGEIHNGPCLSRPALERLACDATLHALVKDTDGNPLYLGRAVRNPTPTQRRTLFDRDGACVYPGCTETRFVDAHHVAWWGRDNGPTDIDNLVLVCWFHHDAIHDRGLMLTMEEPGRPIFHFADGTRVPETTATDNGHAHRLAAETGQLDLDIDNWTATPEYYGDRLNLQDTVDMLLDAYRSNEASSSESELSESGDALVA